MDFLLDHSTALYLWYALLYLVGGGALVVLALGVHDRVRRSQPTMAAVATGFGLIWSGHLLASGMVALLGQRAVTEMAATDPERAESVWGTLSVPSPSTSRTVPSASAQRSNGCEPRTVSCSSA